MTSRLCRTILCLMLLFIGVTPERLPLAERAAVGAPKERDPKAGQHVDWEGWAFNWSIHPRQGLVITDVHFRGKKVLKHAGLAEIFVPYNRGQPRPEDFSGGGIGNR